MKQIWKNLRMWDLWWTFPLILVISYYFDDIITWIDPVGSPLGADNWQFDMLAWMKTVVFANATFGFMSINLPFLFKWYSDSFSTKNIELTSWQKALLFLGFFCAILFAQVLMFSGLVS